MHKSFSIGDKDDKFSFSEKNEKFSFTNDEGKNTEKIIKDKKINYQKRGNKKSIFNNPLTSSRVGERSILQKTVTSPGKLVSGAGASLKEGFNKDIEDSDMAGIQLANQIVSPLARKIRFETNTLIAKKIGFDRKAYNLSKTENKIMKVDKKLFKRKKAQRKMIRKRAMSSAGIKTSVFSRMKIAVVNTKAKIIKKIYNIGKAITTAKSLSFIIPLALLFLVQ